MITDTGRTHRGLPCYIIKEDRKAKKGGFIGSFLIVLILLLMFLPILYHLWAKRTEETVKEEPKEKVKPEILGLDGRSFKDLTGESFLGLPPDEI